MNCNYKPISITLFDWRTAIIYLCYSDLLSLFQLHSIGRPVMLEPRLRQCATIKCRPTHRTEPVQVVGRLGFSVFMGRLIPGGVRRCHNRCVLKSVLASPKSFKLDQVECFRSNPASPTDMEFSSSKGCLQIGVVGAGLAGLSAAIALRRAGHDVEVRLFFAAIRSCQLQT